MPPANGRIRREEKNPRAIFFFLFVFRFWFFFLVDIYAEFLDGSAIVSKLISPRERERERRRRRKKGMS